MCLLVFTCKHVSEAAGWLARKDDKVAPGERKVQPTVQKGGDEGRRQVCCRAEFSEESYMRNTRSEH